MFFTIITVKPLNELDPVCRQAGFKRLNRVREKIQMA